MDWSHDSLWNKAKLYVERALSESRESPLFPFWATIALEFLGRSALAKVNPALLADPQSGDNVLYACGYSKTKAPQSIPAKTVFDRCQTIVPDFTGSEFNYVMSLVGKRNEELHSGGLPYEDFPTEQWLANYFRVCELLLKFQGYSLEDLFGKEEGRVAVEMMAAAREERKTEVLKLVAAHKTIFEGLDPDEKERRENASQEAIRSSKTPYKIAKCPACGYSSTIVGEVVRTSKPRLEDDWVILETIVLPTQLECSVCGLVLKGHESLHIVQLGGQFTSTKALDPTQYYLPSYDEYMNE